MDQKVSGLPQATSVLAADNLILNQNGITKRIAISDFFGSGLPVPVNATGTLLVGSTPEIVSTGAISLAVIRSHIDLTGSQSVTIPAGVDGQIKIVIAATGTGGVTTMTGSLYANAIQFSKLGDAAVLLFTGGKWTQIGGNAASM
jgi:hypothetical protein